MKLIQLMLRRYIFLGIFFESHSVREVHAFYCPKSPRLPRLLSSSTLLSSHDNAVDQSTVSLRRRRQRRRKSINRRPKYYWTKQSNMKRELLQFWKDCGVELISNQPILIPNETLLRYYERHNIRAAIASQGGRKTLSKRLGGARVMPGRWTLAVQQSIELQQLVRINDRFSEDRPPPLNHDRTAGRWEHQNGRKPKGYWDLRRVVEEL